MGHQPKKSLLVILQTVKELGGKPDGPAVHAKADIYKTLGGTVQRLTQLHSMELLDRQLVGKDFIYSVTPEGKQLLAQPLKDQRAALLGNSRKENTVKQCVICSVVSGLVWWKKNWYCPMHLNDDTPSAYIPPHVSSQGW